MAANNMSNIHVSPNVLSTLMALQQENLRKLQQQILHGISRSSRPELFCRKAALKSYAEFTRKHPCWSFFSIKMQDGDAWNFVKKTPTQILSCEICKIFKNTYFKEHLRTTASACQVLQQTTLLKLSPNLAKQ